ALGDPARGGGNAVGGDAPAGVLVAGDDGVLDALAARFAVEIDEEFGAGPQIAGGFAETFGEHPCPMPIRIAAPEADMVLDFQSEFGTGPRGAVVWRRHEEKAINATGVLGPFDVRAGHERAHALGD